MDKLDAIVDYLSAFLKYKEVTNFICVKQSYVLISIVTEDVDMIVNVIDILHPCIDMGYKIKIYSSPQRDNILKYYRYIISRIMNEDDVSIFISSGSDAVSHIIEFYISK